MKAEGRCVIHLSGAPGAGKSTLGAQLAGHYAEDLVVLETDELARRIPSDADASTFTSEWRKALEARLERVYPTCDVLFVGIGDITIDGVTHLANMDGLVTHRFFLEVEDEVLLAQYYGRLGRLPADDYHWKWVASDDKQVMGSRELLALNASTRELHLKSGYRFVTPVEFILALEELRK